MKQLFIASSQSRANSFSLNGRAPIRCSSHGAVMRAETDQDGFIAKTLAHQLTNVHFPVMPHLRGARVAEMRIVRSANRLRAPASIAVRNKINDCRDHAAVAQIPHRRSSAKLAAP